MFRQSTVCLIRTYRCLGKRVFQIRSEQGERLFSPPVKPRRTHGLVGAALCPQSPPYSPDWSPLPLPGGGGDSRGRRPSLGGPGPPQGPGSSLRQALNTCSAQQTPPRSPQPPGLQAPQLPARGISASAQSLPPTIRTSVTAILPGVGSVLLRPSRCKELSVGPRSPGSTAPARQSQWPTGWLRPCVNLPQGKGSGRSARAR